MKTKNAGLVWNRTFSKNDDDGFLPGFSKLDTDCCLSKFLRRCADGNPLMRFQSETPFSDIISLIRYGRRDSRVTIPFFGNQAFGNA